MKDILDNSDDYWDRFHRSEGCFAFDTPALARPVRLLDRFPDSPSLGELVPERFYNLEQLETYLNQPANAGYSCRVISVSQRNSWRPLQITKPMVERLVSHHGITDRFLEASLSFYDRRTEQEHAFTVPCTRHQSSRDELEIVYTFRYAEAKTDPDEPWVIRHTAVYHKLNTATKQSLWILLNPREDSMAEKRVFECVKSHAKRIEEDPLWLHEVIQGSYFANWRNYLAAYEKTLLPIVNTNTATFLSEELRVNHETLTKLRVLERRFLPIYPIITSFQEVLEELKSLSKTLTAKHVQTPAIRATGFRTIENRRKQAVSFIRNARFLHQLCSGASQAVSDTLAFKNQDVAQAQNVSMLRLTRSAVFFTIITIVYLPWTFVATLFGMNFFLFDAQTRNIVVSPNIWIFAVSSVALTALSVFPYFILIRQNKRSPRPLSQISEKDS